MTAAGDVWSVVERQFTGPSWDPETTPWREIALLTGPDNHEDAVEFARSQTTNYTHPARYRVLAVAVTDVFERPVHVGPLGPDDGLCRCGDSIRSAVGTCPGPGDREFEHCPKRKAAEGFRPGTLLAMVADEAAGKTQWRPEPQVPLIIIEIEEDEVPPPRPRTSSLVNETPREW